MLNEDELIRYKRQITLQEIGVPGQEKLKKAKVLVVGAGGLGCPALQYLAAAGVGTIGIIDFDKVEFSNLQRQVIYDEEDIGKYKTLAAALKIKKQNSSIEVVQYCQVLATDNVLSILPEYDIVLDCSDNFPTRYLVNDACVLFNKPFVFGAIHRYEGQVSVFNYSLHETKPVTYRCLFPTSPTDETISSCEVTGVLGVLPGIIGTMQAAEAIKIITGIGEVLSGKLFVMDLKTMKTSILELERNAHVESITPATAEDIKNKNYGYPCSNSSNLQEITAEVLNEWLQQGKDISFLDVREEYESPVVPELSGLKIPLREIEKNQLKINREKQVIIFCKSGNRSAHANTILTNKFRFNNIYNLKGGLEAWFRFKEENQKHDNPS